VSNYQEIANADISAGLSEHNVHDAYKNWSLPFRKEKCEEDSFPFDVAILNVTGELNVGNIIRTASLCGAQAVHVLGRRKYDSRGAVGSENYIDVRRVNLMENDLQIDIESVVDYLDIKNLYPVFIEQPSGEYDSYALGTDTVQLAAKWGSRNGKKPCFIFGNEGRGIPVELIKKYDDHSRMVIYLKQRGVIRSYNVGSTAAIVLYKVMEHYGSRN